MPVHGSGLSPAPAGSAASPGSGHGPDTGATPDGDDGLATVPAVPGWLAGGPDEPPPPRRSRSSRLRRALAAVHRAQAPRSLRVRLLAGLLVLVAVGVTAADAVAVQRMRSFLIQRTDAQLALAAPQITRPGPSARQSGELSSYLVQVFEADGALNAALSRAPLGRSPQDLNLPDLTSAEVAALDGQFFTARATDGERYRVLIQAGHIINQQDGTSRPAGIVIAVSLANVDATAHYVIVVDLIVLFIVLLALLALGVIVVRVGLRPLEDMRRTAERIAAGDLTQRVTTDDDRTEVGRLGQTLNGMLTQIETAFAERTASEERLRRFVADASHELRTPLTSIRGFAELFRAGAAEDPETLARVMRRIEDEAKRMGLLVEDLLLLARLDQQRPLERTPVDLVALASDAVHDAGAVDPGRPLTLAIPEHLVVLGDEMRLRQVVGNLVTNALRHTPEGTPVTVRLAAGDGEAVLEVSDAGPGLAPDVAERVFERFYRVDPSRTRAQGVTKGGGSGLGLSIVAAVVAAHGGRVDLETTPGEGATFRVSLPLPGPGALPAATAGVLPADH